MPIDDDVVDDEYSSDDDDVSVSHVPIVPLLVPRPFLNANGASTNSAGSTTDDDVTLDDNDSIALAGIAGPPAHAPAELSLDFVAPNDASDDDADDVLVAEAPTDTEDVPLDDADDHEVTAQEAMAHAVIHDNDDEIEGVVYEAPDDKHDANGNTDGEVEGAQPYSLRYRQPPTFESYDNPNGIEDLDLEPSMDLESSNFDFSIDIGITPSDERANVFYQSNGQSHINLHQQTQSTKQPYLHHQAKADNRQLPTFDEVRAGYNPTLGELRGMTYQYLVNSQMNSTKGIKLHGERAVEA